ncbi:acyltransferase family protein [Lactiplantibacillus pentosus]|uniref:acyltransferase family protein n=1 Tax=Lactiplantibacillus pentosus TaxID=1589 RepID=UPI00218232DE|nr:acyltransferase family protein [Lactiplantibacillus pentosus]MCT0162167.1 hypothetical protein [Lactiplantibacillus pentosus]
MGRIKWIDNVRGIAIIAVVVGHSLQQTQNGLLNQYIYAIHIPIFFILSGYLYHERSNFGQELVHGNKTMVIPYFFTSLLVIIGSLVAPYSGEILRSPFINGKVGIMSALYGAGDKGNYLFSNEIRPIGAIWFLLCMFLALLLFNQLMIITKNVYYNGFVRLCFFSALALIGTYSAKYYLLPWSVNAALLVQLFLYWGYIIRKFSVDKKISILYLILGFIAWSVAAKQGFLMVVTARSSNMFLSFIGVAGASIVLIQLGKWASKLKRTSRLLRYAGRYSIIVFCFHLIDLSVINVGGVLAAHVNQLFGTGIAAIIVIFYRLIVPGVAVYLVPKIPVIRSIYLPREFPLVRREKQ